MRLYCYKGGKQPLYVVARSLARARTLFHEEEKVRAVWFSLPFDGIDEANVHAIPPRTPIVVYWGWAQWLPDTLRSALRGAADALEAQAEDCEVTTLRIQVPASFLVRTIAPELPFILAKEPPCV